MGLATTLARRSLLGHPSRTIFSILGIAVGIATSVCVFTLDYNTVLGRSMSQDPDWQAEIEVAPSQVVQDPRAELKRVPGVTAVSASFQSDALFVPSGSAGGQYERIHVVALDAEHAGELGALRVIGGRLIAASASEPEVLVGQNLAQRFQLAPGSKILLACPMRAPARECVDGEWQTRGQIAETKSKPMAFTVVGVLSREGLGRKASGDVCVVDYRYGKDLYSGAHVETRYWLKKDPQIDLEHLESSLGQAWSYQLKKSVIVGQAADERAFRNGVRFAGLLAMVLGLYVIFHTLSMSLVERVREIGVLHALGAARSQIARVFFGEAICISAGAGIVGLFGGLFGARVLLTHGVSTVGTGEHINVFEIPWRTVLPLVGAGVAVALTGSVYPLLRVRGANVVLALRGEESDRSRSVARGFQWLAVVLLALILPLVYFELVPVLGETQAELIGVLMMGLGVVALFVSLPLIAPTLIAFVCAKLAKPFESLWPLAGKLAARTMQKGPTRVAGAVAAIGLVAAGYVGLRGMTRSLEMEIAVWGKAAYGDKVFLRNLPQVDFARFVEHMHKYSEVVGVEPGDLRTYVPFLMIGLHVDELAKYGPCLEDPSLVERLKHDKGVIVTSRLAGQQKYKVGDSVHVTTSRGEVLSWPIIAISDAYGYFPHPDERLYAVVSDELMRKTFCIDDSTITQASIQLVPGLDRNQMDLVVRTAVTDFAPGIQNLSLETSQFVYDWMTSDIARDFVLFDVIVGLTVVLAGLGVLNGQLLSALERAKELGILKSLGTTSRQIAGMVLLESAVVGIVGGGLGMLLGWAVAPVIVRSLTVISGLPLPIASPGIHLGIAWIGSIAVALIAGLYPIYRMNRTNAVTAVRAPG